MEHSLSLSLSLFLPSSTQWMSHASIIVTIKPPAPLQRLRPRQVLFPSTSDRSLAPKNSAHSLQKNHATQTMLPNPCSPRTRVDVWSELAVPSAVSTQTEPAVLQISTIEQDVRGLQQAGLQKGGTERMRMRSGRAQGHGRSGHPREGGFPWETLERL